MSNFIVELEQDPFDPQEFVERFAWRATAGKFDVDSFDSQLLFDAFEAGIRDLRLIYDTHQKKCERLEMVCKEVEKRHWIKVAELQEKCKDSFSSFQELDERLDTVAAKVVYLGDQLEGVNTPRSRAVEAQKLMKQFAEFLKPGPIVSPIMTDPPQLYDEADVIQKLHLISQELPSSGKFEKAKEKIAFKYDQIERELIEEFVNSQKNEDRVRMKEIASIMSHFKGYSQCVDAFIEQSQMGIFLGSNIFNDVVPLCEKSQVIVKEVFSNADQVMSKFVLNVYHGKLQEYVQNRLNSDRSDSERYLCELFELYSKTVKLSNQMANRKILGNDISFLNKLTRGIFSKYLDSYIDIEIRTLKEKCSAILQRFYDSKNHLKKPIPSGSIQELKRDLQAKIGRANINIATLTNMNTTQNDHATGETFLSEEVAINILQETKLASQRCHTLSKQLDLPNNALFILDIQLHYLCIEHIDYALELGLMGIPPSEPKSPPEIHFFDVVRQCNAICHLLEKQFVDSILPIVVSTPKHGECLKKKRDILEHLELKLNNGLERTVIAIIGWVKYLLQSEQKKTDFKPETDDVDMSCAKVVRFLNQCVEKAKDCLDGKNVEAFLTELGIRFHRVIYEHLLQFQFSSVGAMFAICDVNEYRRCAAEFRVPLLNHLFDTLHALCNLLVVAPENLKQVCTQANMDRSVLMSFVQLRADYKTAKLMNQMKLN
ncbi:exocyst complex component 5-like protein [Leptotrombidium deliense]|uniref:Exocyst complex component 5 n=1 Tax=Leptotrombidium deliense TaxID=299467 RepID=A0A443SC32_9ACAR|nr:exocyst complex component 5-like protein [Leptotrombidium deliense]